MENAIVHWFWEEYGCFVFQNAVSEVSGLTLNIPRTHSGQWVFHLLFFLILTGGNYYENL